jgi:hypothetical protein
MTSLSVSCCGGMPGRQGPGVDVDAVLAGLYDLLAPQLTEKQRRLLAGAAARALGRGSGARVARLTGLSRPTVYAGVWQLDDPSDPRGRVRGPGGGPKRLVERQPACRRRWRSWSILGRVGILARRCAGRASPPASSLMRLARRGSGSATTLGAGPQPMMDDGVMDRLGNN